MKKWFLAAGLLIIMNLPAAAEDSAPELKPVQAPKKMEKFSGWGPPVPVAGPSVLKEKPYYPVAGPEKIGEEKTPPVSVKTGQ